MTDLTDRAEHFLTDPEGIEMFVSEFDKDTFGQDASDLFKECLKEYKNLPNSVANKINNMAERFAYIEGFNE